LSEQINDTACTLNKRFVWFKGKLWQD